MRHVLRYAPLTCAIAALLPSAAWAGWSQPLIPTTDGENAVFTDVAMNPDGAALVAWYNGAAKTTEAAMATPLGDLSPLVTLSKKGEFGGWPTAAIDAAGNAVVVFTGGSYQNPPEENGVKATFLSRDGEVDGPYTIGTSSSGTISDTGVGMDAAGDAIGWWHPHENRLMYAYRPSGGRFGAPKPIENPASLLERPALAMAANGDAVATWSSRFQIYAAIRPAGGEFGPATPFGAPAAGSAPKPSVAMAPDGAAVVAWVERRDESASGFVRAVYRPPGGVFSAPRTLAEVFWPGVYDVAVAMSPAGEALVMWAGDTWVPKTGWNTTYVTKPPGADFGAPRAGLDHVCEEDPEVAYDAAGNVYAVCRAYYATDEYNQPLGVAYGATRPAGGSFGPAVPLSAAGENVWSPAVAAGPAGLAIVAWPRGWFPSAFHLEVARHSGRVDGPPAHVPPSSPQTTKSDDPNSPGVDPHDELGRLAKRLSGLKGVARRLAHGPIRLRLQMPTAGALGVRVTSARTPAAVLARGRAVFGPSGSSTLVVRRTRAGRRVLARAHARLLLAVTLHLAGQPRVHARLALR